MKPVALYTTFFPSISRFIPEWHASFLGQTRRDVALWVGLDGLSPEQAERACGERLDARWIVASPGDSPAALRAKAVAALLDAGHDFVVLTDADDILLPDRVEAAVAGLDAADVAGCVAELIDARGRPLGLEFPAPEQRADPASDLARWNCFGFSTTAFRRDLLRALPSIPPDGIAADWWLATHAWLAGAHFEFDPAPRMRYRQHGANLAGVLPPFSPERLMRSADIVAGHHALVAARIPAACASEKRSALAEAAAHVAAFREKIRSDRPFLDRYAAALDALPGPHPWWSWVAHPALDSIRGSI
jgi:hypothetical protein